MKKIMNEQKGIATKSDIKEIFLVSKTNEIYNGAQAVRSLGWSFGKDGKLLCDECRKENYKDN